MRGAGAYSSTARQRQQYSEAWQSTMLAARTRLQRILNFTVPTLFLIFTERASLRRAKRRNSRMSEMRFGIVERAKSLLVQ